MTTNAAIVAMCALFVLLAFPAVADPFAATNDNDETIIE